jgi:hypothetical protein
MRRKNPLDESEGFKFKRPFDDFRASWIHPFRKRLFMSSCEKSLKREVWLAFFIWFSRSGVQSGQKNETAIGLWPFGLFHQAPQIHFRGSDELWFAMLQQ